MIMFCKRRYHVMYTRMFVLYYQSINIDNAVRTNKATYLSEIDLKNVPKSK